MPSDAHTRSQPHGGFSQRAGLARGQLQRNETRLGAPLQELLSTSHDLAAQIKCPYCCRGKSKAGLIFPTLRFPVTPAPLRKSLSNGSGRDLCVCAKSRRPAKARTAQAAADAKAPVRCGAASTRARETGMGTGGRCLVLWLALLCDSYEAGFQAHQVGNVAHGSWSTVCRHA